MLIFCLFLGAVLDIHMPWVVSGEQVSETVSKSAGENYGTLQCAALKKNCISLLPLDKRVGVQGTTLQWKERSAVNSVTPIFQDSDDKSVLPLVNCHRN